MSESSPAINPVQGFAENLITKYNSYLNFLKQMKSQSEAVEMSTVKKILINGQWQGGADISTFYGAKEIERLYLSAINYEEANVSSSDARCLPVENNIVGSNYSYRRS
jgi:hypothetical protein